MVVNNMSKLINCFLLIIDFIFVLILISIMMWWKETHMEPGLSEMLNINYLFFWLLVAIVLFILLIIRIMKR